MTFPEEKTKTVSSFNPNIKEVHSISGIALERLGWVKVAGLTWLNGNESITYDGTNFYYKNKPVKFIEDLK